MSSVMEKKFIDVLNCDDNVVTISSLNGNGYTFEPGSVEEPCVIPIPPEEIKMCIRDRVQQSHSRPLRQYLRCKFRLSLAGNRFHSPP